MKAAPLLLLAAGLLLGACLFFCLGSFFLVGALRSPAPASYDDRVPLLAPPYPLPPRPRWEDDAQERQLRTGNPMRVEEPAVEPAREPAVEHEMRFVPRQAR